MISSPRIFTAVFALILSAVAAERAFAAQAYIIVDSKSGYVLQERNSKEKRQIGSLTKIAT
ncbi:MAG: hypothetical protein ACXWAV_06845, partial [Chthoniobacterales bacterium]